MSVRRGRDFKSRVRLITPLDWGTLTCGERAGYDMMCSWLMSPLYTCPLLSICTFRFALFLLFGLSIFLFVLARRSVCPIPPIQAATTLDTGASARGVCSAVARAYYRPGSKSVAKRLDAAWRVGKIESVGMNQNNGADAKYRCKAGSDTGLCGKRASKITPA